MSQHCYDTVLGNESISITMGWENPLQGFFMVIEKSSDEDEPFWSNLTHHQPPFLKTIGFIFESYKKLKY